MSTKNLLIKFFGNNSKELQKVLKRKDVKELIELEEKINKLPKFTLKEEKETFTFIAFILGIILSFLLNLVANIIDKNLINNSNYQAGLILITILFIYMLISWTYDYIKPFFKKMVRNARISNKYDELFDKVFEIKNKNS
ncbi:hypothetical protein A3F29_01445 [Candidatus Roizmanbacteria bacterium RIFCSPHIGHO2_12_FULL_33_9]|uniref:Uncharacterized protein n=1 Tax=Candidatus Roizmanbacteria bacterium RIFCSPHIGHO2_12_FULL_33_9 TaxID=1802045 RepID=A0A1F7HJU5_9BACT|nr:MAG: hypothetical protein A3F29_01445 [Candidatus Roizmanbacteria bacterium RIFCSPHIGHO2_12_FULL_33_9]